MEGDLSLLSIPDLLQMICLGGYSRDIHLFDGPTQLGVIAIRNGQVDRCFGFGTWGEAAFFRLVSLRRGRYKVNEAQDMSASDATLTAYSWQELLMEAARQQDEAARAVQTAAATAGRVIPFPSPTHTGAAGGGAGGATMLREGSGELDFSAIEGPSVAPMGFMPSTPRRSSDTGRQVPISVPASPAPPVLTQVPAEPAVEPALRAVEVMKDADVAPSDGGSHDDVTNLLQEATACYLRRDLARAEALLQKCLELRPGDKRALQNLERIRRKKSP
ncbi:MAG TPA: DUF4388 domain-containing protein [Kofleriaceae bacterium]|nr:DUF4388 domain-containing protein [Kofleriaceae bacterium]